MAPDADGPKRKRSRPSDWWAANPTATPQQDERPKKRGRPSEVADRSIQEAPDARNRGKVGKASNEGSAEAGDRGVKKRGRPSKGGVEEAEVQTAPKKRGRPPKGGVEGAEEEPAPKKRGRPSLSKAEEPSTQDPGPSKRKRGRPSKTQEELEAAQQSAAQSQADKKRGRRSDASDAVAEGQESQKDRKGKGPSDNETSQSNRPTGDKSRKKRQEADTNAEGTQTEPRRSQKSARGDGETLTEEVPGYQHLAEVTHRVARQTIEAKWEALPAACVDRVSSLLDDIQRPVIVRFGDERRRAQAGTALQMVSRRLVSKISKGLPFPQSAGARREDDFNFERILGKSRDLEAQLTLALHANDLLESELDKENAHLEAEEEALAELEANAKIESTRRKDAGRKLHALLQVDDDAIKDEAGFGGDAHEAALSLQDDDLATLAEKLTGHIDSIQGNVRQVQGITQAMARSRAAVQATLFGHLESAQYADIVLG